MSLSLNIPWRISLFIERMLSLRFSLCERCLWLHWNCACDVCVPVCMPEGLRRTSSVLPCYFLPSFPGFLIEPGSRTGASKSQRSSCFSYQRHTWPCPVSYIRSEYLNSAPRTCNTFFSHPLSHHPSPWLNFNQILYPSSMSLTLIGRALGRILI